MKNETLLKIIREEIQTVIKENPTGDVKLPKTTSPNDVKKFTDNGVDVEIVGEMARAKVSYALVPDKKTELEKVASVAKGNTKMAIEYILNHGEMSIADLSKEIGKDSASINNPGFRKIMSDLSSRGIIKAILGGSPEGPKTSSSPKSLNKISTPTSNIDNDFEKESPSDKEVAAAEKEFGDIGAEKLEPTEKEKFEKLTSAIKNKVSKLEKLSPKERAASTDMVVLKQIISKPEVKKLFKAKGIDVLALVSSVIS